MNATDNKALARRIYEEAFHRKNFAALDALIAPTAIDHNPAPGAAAGREGMREAFQGLRAACPHLCVTIDDAVAEGDCVALRWTMRGTRGGKSVTVSGADMLKFRNGQVIERWGSRDAVAWRQAIDWKGASARLIRYRIRKYVTQLKLHPSWAPLGAV